MPPMPTSTQVDTRRRVLRYLKLGWPVRKIADTLGVSTQAVYQHRARLLEDGEWEKAS